MTRALALAVGLACAGGAPIARADTPPVDHDTQAKADLLFQKAQAHFQADEFAAALELFQQAYDLVHDPVYLFNIAQSYRKTLDCTAASTYYGRYLDAAPAAPNRAKVEAWIRELEPCVDQRTAEHAAAERGAELDRQHKAEEAERQRIARLPRTQVVDQGAAWRIGGLALGGAGVLGLVLGLGEGLHSGSLADRVKTACASGCNWNSEAGVDASGRSANTYAKLGYIGGGIALLGGVALYFVGRSRVETVQITPQPGGGVVSARLAF